MQEYTTRDEDTRVVPEEASRGSAPFPLKAGLIYCTVAMALAVALHFLIG